MKPNQEKVITPEQLKRVVALLFNKSTLSGGEIARKLERDSNALWLDVHKYGLPVGQALAMAKICDAWVIEIQGAARALRFMAKRAKLTKREYSLSKRKVGRNRTT